MNQVQVFSYLHNSSLYWDEHIFLPLFGLKSILLIAAKQNAMRTLEEINFIINRRPRQSRVAQAILVAIAFQELEMCNSLYDIAQVSENLAKIFPQETEGIDPEWIAPFALLDYASHEAARYSSSLPISMRARYEALNEVITNLTKISNSRTFSDDGLNKRLSKVVHNWLEVAQKERETAAKVSSDFAVVDNPYSPGPVLDLRNNLFVGRRDIAQQLEEALIRRNRRPTFFLSGERRMGKSSTLKQLPDLLGTHYLPIFYDLQSRGVSSSAAHFLGAIAQEIYKVMVSNGMSTRKLEYAYLKEASRENEAAVYYLFDEWFKSLERILEQEDRTLLLTFDEFEKLEEAAQDGYLNLPLLLDWFRSVVQDRPRLALLFSGVHTLGEMDIGMAFNWASYFVNVQTLRVSFLQPIEARKLITQPVPDFPSERIYGRGVVDEITRVTGCHPFLVQAMCSSLIDNLNVDKRERAEIPDVAIAMNQVLENWWDTYFRDLWERTDQEQRTCLVTMRSLGEGDEQKIVEKSGLDEKTIRRTVLTLLKRDLILLENVNYRIAAPIFGEWVERNS